MKKFIYILTIIFTLTLVSNAQENVKNGKLKIYDNNGSLIEIRSYKNNLMNGTWITYNNDLILSKASYKNGMKHGKWLIYDNNGNLIYNIRYKNNKKVGTWKKYNLNELVETKNY